MAKRKASPRQQEILDLMKERPGITAAEIADELRTSQGAIYQQISRLRSAKLLPKAKGGSRPHLSTPASPGTKQTAGSVSSSVAVSNGHAPGLSLEDHVAEELGGVTERIKAIIAERAEVERARQERLDALGNEEEGLTERQKRLTAVSKALAV